MATRWQYYTIDASSELQHLDLTHHNAGVELVEALHSAVAKAVAQVLLDKVGVV